MVKSGIELSILKFNQSLQSLQKYLVTGQVNSVFLTRDFLHRAAATLKLVAEFQNKKSSPLFIIILSQFKTRDFSSLIE